MADEEGNTGAMEDAEKRVDEFREHLKEIDKKDKE
jgi:hypothetical protein